MRKFIKYPTYIRCNASTNSKAFDLVVDAIEDYLDNASDIGFVDRAKDFYLFTQYEDVCKGTISDAAGKLSKMMAEDPELDPNSSEGLEDIYEAVIYDCVEHSKMEQEKFMALCYKYGHGDLVEDYE